MATQLGPQLASHQATVEALPTGAVVRVPEATLFAPGQTELNGTGQFIVSSIAESLLDPTLMRVTVDGSPQTPEDLRLARAKNVRHYVEVFSLGPPLQMAALAQPAANASSPAAMSVAIYVQCPPGVQGSTWKYQVAGPTCN